MNKKEETKSYRKFDKCQKCGGEFTTEHRFAAYCKKCNPKAIASGVVKKTLYGRRMLSNVEFKIRYLEYSVGVLCVACNREIDIVSGRTQDFEAVCPGCGRSYRPVFRIEETVAGK